MARWGSQGGGGGGSRGHRARDERGLEGRWPHVLARRAHRIDRSGQGWMVCRVPVAFQIATGDDARSLRPTALLPAKRRTCGAATPVFLQVQRVMTRAIGDQPGHPCHESAMATTPPRLFLLASA